MRIIAGTHRGRRYLPPKDEKTTRPITDRVKQSLFDRLWSQGALPDPAPEVSPDPEDSPPPEDPQPPEDQQPPEDPQPPEDQQAQAPVATGAAEPFEVLDIFCGTGSLGLEALSRGADRCTFVDMDRDAVGRLEQNLTALGLTDRARVVKAGALNPVWLAQLKPGSIDLVFLDPPYAISEDEQGRSDLTALMGELGQVTAPGCFLTLRTAKDVTPDPVDGWDGPTSHNYGSMTVHFFIRNA
jgi:16S rRNA (guanine966-N2)-methyltransferase